MPHVIKIICPVNEMFFTTFLIALSKKYSIYRKPLSLLSALQQFDLNTLLSLPVSNTLQKNYRSKKALHQYSPSSRKKTDTFKLIASNFI